MNLHEYQAKKLFLRYRLPVPEGYTCTRVLEAESAFLSLGSKSCIAKCQVHAGGRQKAGGIKILHTLDGVRSFTESWLGKSLHTYQTDKIGQPVHQILVEELISINMEMYLALTIDYCSSRVIFLASRRGGIDIERVAMNDIDAIHKTFLDPIMGAQQYQGRIIASKLGLVGKQILQFVKVFVGMVTIFYECDATLVEVNPLAVNTEGDLVCLDTKIRIDDNALFRQPELEKIYDHKQENLYESSARKLGLSYVALEGNIGCIVNGAGLAMGTMDILKDFGGQPANFLDVGGGITSERVAEAFKLILSNSAVRVIFINIFGGIVRCDLVADGIISAISGIGINIPIVARLEGNQAEIARHLLNSSGLEINTVNGLKDGARLAVKIATGGKKCPF
jgi:succinyl-CoA synthetase beta subunit